MLPIVYSGSYELLSCIPAQLICFYVLWSEVDRCQGPVTILVVTHLPTKVNNTNCHFNKHMCSTYYVVWCCSCTSS